MVIVEQILYSLRAKPKDENNYLLKDHLKETIERAIQLKNFIDKNRSAINYNGFSEEFFKNLVIACFLHDLGKIDWKFQSKVYGKEKNSSDLKKLYDFFGEFRKIDIKDHEVISLVYSLLFLDNSEWSQKIRTAILLHHYNNFYKNREINIRSIFDDYPQLEKYIDFLISKKGEIKELLELLLEKIISEINDDFAKNVLNELKTKFQDIGIENLKKFKERLDKGASITTALKMMDIPDREDKNFYDFFFFLGCLRRADYSASGNIDIEKIKNLAEEVYKDLEEKIKKKVKTNDLWQEDILNKNDSINLILVAPTGSGKTEFALLWAKKRNRKLIYTLPLRVALNDLFWRFSNKEKGYFDEEDLSILHSTSFIEYLKEEKEGEETSVSEKQISARTFSLPLMLTTADQVFLSCLKYYGFDKLLSVYPLSAIVIDEIQAYNPEMAAVIIKTLDIIKELSGSILLTTATFPPYFEEFFEAKGFKKIDLEKEGTEIKNQIKNYNLKRHKIKLLSGKLFDYEKKDYGYELKLIEDSYEQIERVIKENSEKNILIIVNNVGKAIELYKKIEKEAENLRVKKENVYLLHSRLIEKEKTKRIEDIKKKLEKERVILISTQIVEASVDVDFDILITEISPIDSQIQRWGRIWRNRDKDYEGEPNMIIFIGNYRDGEVEIDKGTTAIYDKRVIEKTIKVLIEMAQKVNNNEFVIEKVLDYEKERELIEKVFEEKVDNKKLKEIYAEEIKKNLEWLSYYSAEKRSEAQKIFRRIAGIQVVVPDLMVKSSDSVEKAFGEIIKDKENWKLPWESEEGECVIEKVKNKINNENEKNKVNKWELLKILYLYSFNLPIFFFGNGSYNRLLENKTFKGFFVLNTKGLSKEDLEEIEKYGVWRLNNVDIDNEELKVEEENENIL